MDMTHASSLVNSLNACKQGKETRPRIVACIAAFNEEKNIGSVIVKAKDYVDHVLVCDDGSSDLTGKIAEGLGAIVVEHGRNKGKGAALRSIFSRAKDMDPDIVVMLDADGQHDPSEIPSLIKPIVEGKADMVVGSRYVAGAKMNAPLYRRFGLIIINSLSGITGNHEVADTQSGFRAFSARALDVMLESESEGYGVETEQLALSRDNDLRVVEVPVTITYTKKNTSKNNLISHSGELFETIFRLVVEDKPSTIIIPGFLILLLGIISGIYFLWYFNATRYFSIPFALITLGASIIGTLLIVTSVLLYAIKRMRQ